MLGVRRSRSLSRRILRVLVASSVLLAAGACVETEPAPPRYRNLVIVLVDTLRADHLPSYGYPRNTAPELSRLSAAGIQLEGYASSSWTRPSVATLLTGHSPQRHQAIARSDKVLETVPYLPQLLDQAGYFTAAIVGNLNVGRRWGFARGFDRFRQLRANGKVDAQRINAELADLLPDTEPPFFLYLHYVDPHDPYQPAEPWPNDDVAADRPVVQPRRLLKTGASLDAESRQRLIDLYDGEILEVDQAIGSLLEELRSRGLLEETLVVVTSDHGEEFGEHEGLLHGRTLFEEVVRVPLLLWAESPPLPRQRFPTPVFQVDLLATLLEALGAPPVASEGRSRWPSLAAGTSPEASAVGLFHLDLDGHAALAARQGSLKLVHTPETPHDRLYDLASDPQERSPTHAEPTRIEPLRHWLLEQHNLAAVASGGRRIESLDPETRQALESLGYVEPNESEVELRRRVIPGRLPPSLGFADPAWRPVP